MAWRLDLASPRRHSSPSISTSTPAAAVLAPVPARPRGVVWRRGVEWRRGVAVVCRVAVVWCEEAWCWEGELERQIELGGVRS